MKKGSLKCYFLRQKLYYGNAADRKFDGGLGATSLTLTLTLACGHAGKLVERLMYYRYIHVMVVFESLTK